MEIDSSITRVTVGNTEIQKIMHGGGILWQKIYRWKVYKVNTVNVYKYKLKSKEERHNIIQSQIDVYRNISINEDTGEISLTEKISLYEDYSKRYGYSRDLGNIYYGFYGANGPEFFDGQYIYYASSYLASSNKERGSFEKEISSISLSAYPKNGIKGEYWYEFVG